MRTSSVLTLIAISALLIGCGDDGGSAGNDGGDSTTDAPAADADPNAPDGALADGYVPPNCTPGATECSDCVDNDGDNQIDLFDAECTKADDNDEGSFATGIPGDNQDPVVQDCYFDGDSGQGNDPCGIHTCCIVDECPPNLQGSFDPESCTPISQECVDQCLGATTVGCDCFGCCTVCVGDACNTVFTHPLIAPECSEENLFDPTKCPVCTQQEECVNPCEPGGCTLCPGQDPSELPPECTEPECPAGSTSCQVTEDCGTDQYCSAGCCLDDIVID